MRLQISVLYYLLLFLMNINAFHLGQTAHLSRERRGDLSMTWTFKTLDGSPLEKHGIIGSEGELFFHPLVSASINIPDEVRSAIPEILSPSLQLPVIATSKPLLPGCRDWFLSKDMNHRRLFYENAVGSDIALLPFSASQKRLGLVGVVARIESKELTDDGSCKAILHAYSRCFLLQFTNDEDPYLIAHVQRFEDFAAYLKEPTLDIIENQILQKLIINMKVIYRDALFYSFLISTILSCLEVWRLESLSYSAKISSNIDHQTSLLKLHVWFRPCSQSKR